MCCFIVGLALYVVFKEDFEAIVLVLCYDKDLVMLEDSLQN
jgi:hypothetical protein